MSPIYPEPKIRRELEKQGDTDTVFGDMSPGVKRIEAITSCFTSWHLWVLFIAIFFVACESFFPGDTRGLRLM